MGVKDVRVVDAFDIKALRHNLESSLDSNELSVIIVRGICSVRLPVRSGIRIVNTEKCSQCGTCLLLGCPAIQEDNEKVFIDGNLCVGDACSICQQICPKQAIVPQSEIIAE